MYHKRIYITYIYEVILVQITYLGASEGEWVGEELGCSDGEADAVRVGAALGLVVGIPVGLAEGLAVVVTKCQKYK